MGVPSASIPVLALQQHFLARVSDAWAYLTLGASGIVTEELAPILGGIAVHEGHLALWPVIAAVGVGTWLATLILYAVGRWRSRWVSRKWHVSGGKIRRMTALVRLHPRRASFLVRWAFGARIALPLACGVARVALPTYALVSLASSLLWSALFASLGWVFGESAMIALAHARRVGDWLFLGALIAGVAIAGIVWWRRGREREVGDR